MKKVIGILICLSLASCEHISAPNESQHSQPIQFRLDSYPDDSTFYVQNLTHVNLDSVKIQLIDSSIAYIAVPDSGIYGVKLTQPPATCFIKQQSLTYGIYKWFVINLHTGVHGYWTTPNVVIVDESEQN